MAHELHPLDGSQTEKYFILRDYSINDKIGMKPYIFQSLTYRIQAFTFPNSASELPVPLRSHYTQLKDVTTQMETIYSSAEVGFAFYFRYNAHLRPRLLRLIVRVA